MFHFTCVIYLSCLPLSFLYDGNCLSAFGTFSDFIVLYPDPLHFTMVCQKKKIAIRYLSIVEAVSWIISSHLKYLIFYILLHLLFYGPSFSSEPFLYRNPYFYRLSCLPFSSFQNKMKQSLEVTYIWVYDTSKQKHIEDHETLRGKTLIELETKCRFVNL